MHARTLPLLFRPLDSERYEMLELPRSHSSTSGSTSTSATIMDSHTMPTGVNVGLDAWASTPESESEPGHATRDRVHESLSASTYRRNLWGWYLYAFASEVFVIVSLALFLPICLEQYARDNGYVGPERVGPCVGGRGVGVGGGGGGGGGVTVGSGVNGVGGVGMEVTGAGMLRSENNGIGGGGGACAVRLGWVWVDTTSFSLYVYSISVALQAVTVISMGGIADHPPHRKRILLTSASLGSVAAILFFFLPSTASSSLSSSLSSFPSSFASSSSFLSSSFPSSFPSSSSPFSSPPSSSPSSSSPPSHPQYTWLLAAPLAILANIGLGASVVALNAYIPALARRAPEVVGVWVGVGVGVGGLPLPLPLKVKVKVMANKGGSGGMGLGGSGSGFYGGGGGGDSSEEGAVADADEEDMDMDMDMERDPTNHAPLDPDSPHRISSMSCSESESESASSSRDGLSNGSAGANLYLDSDTNLNANANDSTPLLLLHTRSKFKFDGASPSRRVSDSGALRNLNPGSDINAPLHTHPHTHTQKTYQTALSRTTARISSHGIAIGYAAGISVLGIILLVMMLFADGETSGGYGYGYEAGERRRRRGTEALRRAIGASGVWWAVFTVPAGMWLPDSDYVSSSPTRMRTRTRTTAEREGEGGLGGVVGGNGARGRLGGRGRVRGVGDREKRGVRVSKEIGDAWVRLGNMLRWREVNKLRNTFKFLAAWFLLSDGLTTISSTTLLFSKTTLRMSPSSLVLIGLLTPTSGILSSLLLPYIQRRYGFSTQRILLLLGIMASLVPAYGALGLFLAGTGTGGRGGEEIRFENQVAWRWGGLTTQGEMFAVSVYFGAVYAAFQGYARAFYADLLPPTDGARWYALFSIAGKSSSFIGPLVVGLISDMTGNIRYAFVFLVCMIWAALPVLASVDVDRGRRDAAGYEYEEDVEGCD